MRIVIIGKAESTNSGGMGIFSGRLTQYLTGKGHEVFHLQFTNSERYGPNTIPLRYHFADDRTFVVLPRMESLAIARARLRQLRPDVVYLNIATSPLDFVLPTICHDLGIPVAGVWHGDFHSGSWSAAIAGRIAFTGYLGVCRHLDMLQVFSHALREYFVKHGVEGRRVHVIPNGVDTEKYRSPALTGPISHPNILALGRVTTVKNPELLIKSFNAMDHSFDARLSFVGDGELLDKLRLRYGATNNLKFCGAITDETEKLKVINSSHIFVLPSRFEGMSLSLLEAMSCGLACVVSDVGTNREVVGDAGIVIPYRELRRRLPDVLSALARDEAYRRSLGVRARARVLANFQQEAAFGAVEERLQRLAEEGRARRLAGTRSRGKWGLLVGRPARRENLPVEHDDGQPDLAPALRHTLRYRALEAQQVRSAEPPSSSTRI